MRGFAGLLVAAAFALLFFHSLQVQRGAWEGRSLELEAALRTTQLRAVEDDLQYSFAMVVRKAGAEEKDAGKRAAIILLELAEWDERIEEKYAGQGILADAWVGAISSEEKSRLPVEMLEEKKALKCLACLDFALAGKKFEARNAAAHVPAAENLSTNSFLRQYLAGAGWSVYLKREGLASVSQAEFELT